MILRGGAGRVTEGRKLTPTRDGAAQVGEFHRGQRRDLVRLAGEAVSPHTEIAFT